MGRRGLFGLGLLLGTLIGWLVLRRRLAEPALPAPADVRESVEDRIVLPKPSNGGSGSTHRPAEGEIVVPTTQAPGTTPPAETERQTGVTAPAAEARVEVAAPTVEAPDKTASAEDAAAKEPEEVVEGYCVRCKEQRRMTDVHHYLTANKRPAVKGHCAVCGAGMSKFTKE